MIQQSLFVKVMDKINNLGFPYMITGGIATLFYGKPRITHDIDVIVAISQNFIPKIIETFKEDFYVSEEGIRDAIFNKTMFNIIHPDTGIKVDFWLLKDSEYDRVMFQRRLKKEIFGKEVYISTPEDAIIEKLHWHKESDIDKHFDDALGILQVQHENLDFDYIEQWAEKLEISDIWEKLKKEIGDE